MKKLLFLLATLLIMTDLCAQYYGGYYGGYGSYHSTIDSSQAGFYIHRRHYSDINYPLAFALHHSIIQLDGCNGEWGFWFECVGVELGMGFDFGRYNETLVSEERHSWFGGDSYKIWREYSGTKGSTMIVYLGAYIRNYISAGAVMDFGHGKYHRTSVYKSYGNYIESDFDDYGPFLDDKSVGMGLYVKGNYQFTKNLSVFLLGRVCTNGNNGLLLGVGANF